MFSRNLIFYLSVDHQVGVILVDKGSFGLGDKALVYFSVRKQKPDVDMIHSGNQSGR
jgi:hypothetical protein